MKRDRGSEMRASTLGLSERGAEAGGLNTGPLWEGGGGPRASTLGLSGREAEARGPQHRTSLEERRRPGGLGAGPLYEERRGALKWEPQRWASLEERQRPEGLNTGPIWRRGGGPRASTSDLSGGEAEARGPRRRTSLWGEAGAPK